MGSLCAFLLLLFIVKYEANTTPEDPCRKDGAGFPTRCRRTTKEEKCPNPKEYLKDRFDESLVCCCPCGEGYATLEDPESTICHLERLIGIPTTPVASTVIETSTKISTIYDTPPTTHAPATFAPKTTSEAPLLKTTTLQFLNSSDRDATEPETAETTLAHSLLENFDGTVLVVMGVMVILLFLLGMIFLLLCNSRVRGKPLLDDCFSWTSRRPNAVGRAQELENEPLNNKDGQQNDGVDGNIA